MRKALLCSPVSSVDCHESGEPVDRLLIGCRVGHSGEFVGPIRERSIALSPNRPLHELRADNNNNNNNNVREPKSPNLGDRLRGSHSVTGGFFHTHWPSVVGLVIGEASG